MTARIKNNKSTSLTVIESQEYAILKVDPQLAVDVFAENAVPGQGMSLFDLDNVTLPAGGGLAFEIQGPDGPEIRKKLVGVIALQMKSRAYWKVDLEESGGGAPPDCASVNELIGVGDPGGDCVACPLAQFGSNDKSGRGQACKERRLLFLIQPNSLLPMIISLPPTSLKAINQFMRGFSAQARVHYSAVTELTLEKERNSAGTEYSHIVLRRAGDLTPEQTGRFKIIKASLQNLMETRPPIPPTVADTIGPATESKNTKE